MKKYKIGIIGAGNIGAELYTRVPKLGWDVFFIAKEDGIYRNLTEKIDEIKNIDKYAKDVDLVFLAIPTFDDGLAAFNYLKLFLEKKIPVVTCEKGALGNYFNELNKYLSLIGYSAAVGGGSRILNYAKERITSNTHTIKLILNGTLNYIFYQLNLDKKLEEVIMEVQNLKYSEPGVNNTIDIINKEATGDVPLKISILLNVLNLCGKSIKAREILVKKISEEDINVIEESKNFRYFITLSKKEIKNEDNIKGFDFKLGEWFCSGGFKKVGEDDFIKFVKGVDNGIEIIENDLDGIYRLTGPGAGPGATVSSMIKDAEVLLKNNQVNDY